MIIKILSLPNLMLLMVMITGLVAGCSQQIKFDDTLTSKSVDSHNAVTQDENPAAAGWELVWQDEFDSSSVDPQKWNREHDCWGGGNNELQCYTDRPENAFIADGLLHLVAREERFNGPRFSSAHPDYDRNDSSRTSSFTSARLHTLDHMSIRYGRIDIRARIAGGKGMWPAIWMLPSDSVYGNWPASGEIDIMEALNPGIGPNEVHGTLHYGLPWPQWENKVSEFHMDTNPADAFHIYSIEWEADELRWYVDGVHYQTQTSAGWYNYVWSGQEQGFRVANPRAPFDQEFFLIMNIAIGGNWPGDPDRDWPTDREMLIDYVRVYQCAVGDPKDPAYTGEGCGAIDSGVMVNTDFGAPGVNTFDLFSDGPAVLRFDIDGGEVINALEPGTAAIGSARVEQSQLDIGGERGTVWDIRFAGEGSVFLASKGVASVPGYEPALVLGGGAGWGINGEIEFDLLVKRVSADSELTVQLDSGEAGAGSAVIDLPETGEWQKVVVKVGDIITNPPRQDGGVDLMNVQNTFVLTHSGEFADVQIDNIRLQCAFNREPETWQLDQTCGLYPRKTPPVPIVVKVNDLDWTVWDCCGGANFNEVEDGAAGGRTVEFSFADKPTAPGFKAPRPFDLTAYAGGRLEFDFKLVTAAPPGSPWYVKLESAASAAQVYLTDGGPAPDTQWQRYSFPLTGDLTTADFNNVLQVLIFPEWGKAHGAGMRIANLRFVAP